ncbi:MAG: alpha/beta hydrolase, partial [Stenotrophomonas sp.]
RGHGDLAASVYMYVGEYEAPAFGNDADMVADAKQIDAALRARRYPSLRLKLDVLNDEDHLSVAPRGLTHGLKYLLGKTPGSGG